MGAKTRPRGPRVFMTELGISGERDRWLAELAGRQHADVAWWQIRDAGIPRAFVDTRVARGRLHQAGPGVFSVGCAVSSREGRWMAAVLAKGPGSALSHTSAAALWGLLPAGDGALVHLSVADARNARPSGDVVVHRRKSLERAAVSGIPVTTVATTLLDLAATVDERRLEQAVENAERLKLFHLTDVQRVAGEGRRGSRALLEAVAEYDDAPTKQEFERRFLQLCRRRGLPRPDVNVHVAGFERDFVWPLHRVIVEADSRRFHGTWQAAERDRERDATATLAGYRSQRFTWRQLTRKTGMVEEVLRMLLRG